MDSQHQGGLVYGVRKRGIKMVGRADGQDSAAKACFFG